MKLISWDIGINNLAYCLMENNDIIEWNVVDILADIRKKIYYCEKDMKNNVKCNKKASFYNDSGKYCGMHGKGMNKLLDHEECSINNKNGKKCSTIPQFYNEDGYYCNKHSKNIDQNKLNRYITEKNVTFSDRAKYLYKTLKNLDNILDIDIVLIENQPVFKNPIMKSLQMLLYGYYLERNKEIILMNATQKLKVYNGPSIECNIKDVHEKNKYLGKEYCRYFLSINNNNNMLSYFESFSKKDDLADTYLQALYYLSQIKT